MILNNQAGINYASTAKPSPLLLTVPATGQTSRQAEKEILRNKNVGNAWDVVASSFEAQKKMHNAHKVAYESVSAGIKTATAYVGASTDWHGYQKAIAHNRIARNDARTTIASIPLEVERQNAELEIKRANVERARLTLEQSLRSNEQLREDLSHGKMIAHLDGYVIDVSLPSLIQGISGTSSYEEVAQGL